MLSFGRRRRWLILGSQTRPFTTLSSLFSLCKNPKQLSQIHARFVLHGLDQSSTVSSELVDRYASFGLIRLSERVFDSAITKSSVLYRAMLRSLAEMGDFERTIVVYRDMVADSAFTDGETLSFVFRAFSSLGGFEKGKIFHAHLVKLGLDSCGNGEGSFRIFQRMRMESLEANSVTLIGFLRSCVDMNSLIMGKSVHCLVLIANLGEDLSVNTALLSMYSKFGDLKNANRLLEKMPERDCVVWNIMISANSRNGKPMEALQVLRSMGRFGVRADFFTALPVISSITKLKAVELGKQIHAFVIRNSLDCQVSVHNSLIDMYCECDRLSSARKIFDSLANKSLVSWSAMIKGYVLRDRPIDALSLFSEMKSHGIKFDFITVINVLPACVSIGALENVKYLHGHSIKSGLSSLASLNTTFLVSYAKCGCIEMAQKLFDEIKSIEKDIITWNSMISAYAKHGDWQHCFELYNQMKESSTKPDQITFLGLLTACVNSGLVKEGKKVFNEMTESYNCRPNQEHYACMVDLLGRAGIVNEARELVKSMPFEPDARVWGPLLSSCKLTNSETGLAEYAAEKLIKMEPKNAGNYVLLSNIYAAAGKWDGVARMRSALRDRGIKKTPGLSWLEISGLVHEFTVGDRSHPRSNDIYRVLGHLELEIKYVKRKSSKKE